MTKQKKYTYYNVIQQNYGFGWEDVSFYETNSQYINFEKSGKKYIDSKGKEREYSLVGHDLKEYRFTVYPTRLINRKELNKIN
jgi:hypothetical protein